MSEQTDRYHKAPFKGFAPGDENRRKQIVSLPMDVLLALFRERLEYFTYARSDPDAVMQHTACEIERAMGVFPNIEGRPRPLNQRGPPMSASESTGFAAPTDESVAGLVARLRACSQDTLEAATAPSTLAAERAGSICCLEETSAYAEPCGPYCDLQNECNALEARLLASEARATALEGVLRELVDNNDSIAWKRAREALHSTAPAEGRDAPEKK